jgi:hypothetical protein
MTRRGLTPGTKTYSWLALRSRALNKEYMKTEIALEIITQIIKDRKQWGQSAGFRVAAYEVADALLALEGRFSGEWVPKEDLTLSNRRYAQLNAIHEKLKKRLGVKDGDTSQSD